VDRRHLEAIERLLHHCPPGWAVAIGTPAGLASRLVSSVFGRAAPARFALDLDASSLAGGFGQHFLFRPVEQAGAGRAGGVGVGTISSAPGGGTNGLAALPAGTGGLGSALSGAGRSRSDALHSVTQKRGTTVAHAGDDLVERDI